jgi:hypothetical protein
MCVRVLVFMTRWVFHIKPSQSHRISRSVSSLHEIHRYWSLEIGRKTRPSTSGWRGSETGARSILFLSLSLSCQHIRDIISWDGHLVIRAFISWDIQTSGVSPFLQLDKVAVHRLVSRDIRRASTRSWRDVCLTTPGRNWSHLDIFFTWMILPGRAVMSQARIINPGQRDYKTRTTIPPEALFIGNSMQPETPTGRVPTFTST